MKDGYTEIAYPGFGKGLNLRDQPNEITPDQAMDALNVIFVGQGVQQRPGYLKFTSVVGTNRYDCMIPYYTSAGTKQLVVGAGNRLEALDTTGAIVASSTAPTANPHFFTRFGGPTAELVYAANGTDNVRQWNGAAWSAPGYTGTAPTGKFLAVTPWDNRMVNARRGGATAGLNPSSVRFSDPNLPLTWGANNYVDLLPGDGEEIMGIIAWRELLFIFKETKYFIFYGTTADASGNPVFQYRTVGTGVGLAANQGLTVGTDGVYFLARTGVYRTNGGEPQLVSKDLEGVFAQQAGIAPPFYTGAVIRNANISQGVLAWWDERIYLAVPTTATTNDRTFVFDTRHDWWSVYDLPVGAMARFRVSNDEELLFAYSSGTKDIGRHRQSDSTDDGTNIRSFVNYGWTDDQVAQQHVLRAMKLWGKGTVTAALATDFGSAGAGVVVDFTVGADTWGSGSGSDTWGDGTGVDLWGSGLVVVGKYVPKAYKGSVFSLQFSNQSGSQWAIYRGSKLLRDVEIPNRVRA